MQAKGFLLFRHLYDTGDEYPFGTLVTIVTLYERLPRINRNALRTKPHPPLNFIRLSHHIYPDGDRDDILGGIRGDH